MSEEWTAKKERRTRKFLPDLKGGKTTRCKRCKAKLVSIFGVYLKHSDVKESSDLKA